jgi:type III pantothenate kinase
LKRLILDIGNSRNKWAVFQDDELEWQAHGELSPSDLSQILKDNEIEAAIQAASGDSDPERLELLAGLPVFIELSHETPLPFEMAYETPETLGRDRIAGVAGGIKMFPEGKFLSIDAGTCVTYDYLDAQLQYRGGAIAPGWQMRLQSMHTFTAKLPLVERMEEQVPELVGKSTADSLRSGAFHGLCAEIEATIDRYVNQFGELKVVLSGGDTEVLQAWIKRPIFANPNLVLEGLNKILSYNVLQKP